MYQAIAATAQLLPNRPGFDNWLTSKTRDGAVDLYQRVGHLMTAGTEQEAWAELVGIWTEAHRIAVGMVIMPIKFDFIFPPLSALFDPSQMVNHDPVVRADPLTLRTRGARIRLAVTPVATMMPLTEIVQPRVFHYAKVLVSVP
jgi:hypothetical protein